MDIPFSWQHLTLASPRPKALGASLTLALSLLGGCDKGATTPEETPSDKQSEKSEPTDTNKSQEDPESKKPSPEKSKGKDPEDEKKTEDPDEKPSSEDSNGNSNATGTQDSSSSEGSATDNKDGTEDEKPDGGEEKIPCEGDTPRVVLDTQFGKVIVDLDGTRAPITVKNFSQYVNDKFFDNTIFHRIIKNFVVQGGGHDLDGKLKEARPPIKLEIHPELRHTAGTISMARTQEKDSANSQFFLCTTQRGCKGLDDEYAAFGQTVEGMDVITKMAAVKTDGKPNDKPLENVVLKSAYCIKGK